MRNLFVVLLFGLSVYSGYGQTTFSTLYNSGDSLGYNDSMGIGYSIIIDDSFYYVVGLGNVDLGAIYLDIFFLKTDLYGNRIIAKYYYGNDSTVYLPGYYNNLSVSNNYLITGAWLAYFDTLFPINEASKAMYMKFNKLGDTLLTRLIVGDGYSVYSNSVLNPINQAKWFVGVTRDTLGTTLHTIITEYDSLDNLIIEKKFGNGFNNEGGTSVSLMASNNILIASEVSYDDFNINSDGKIYETDVAGNTFFSKTFGTTGYDKGYYANLSINKTAIISSHLLDTTLNEGDYEYTSCITKMDLDGNIHWRTFFNNPYLQFFYTTRDFEDGSIVAIGIKEIDTNYVYNGFICKLDSNGVVLWERTYTNNPIYDHYLFDFQKTADGGYICSGAGTDGDEFFYEGPMWLLKLDSMGCLIPGCDATPIINTQGIDNTFFIVYPNPISNTSTVEINIPPNFQIIPGKKLSLNIYDIAGKLADRYSNIIVNNPNEVIRFNIYKKNLAKGIYEAELNYGGNSLGAVKVVVE